MVGLTSYRQALCWGICCGREPHYQTKILEYSCARVKTSSENAEDERGEMHLSGEDVEGMVSRLTLKVDVLACRARESEGMIKVEIRDCPESRARVMTVMASLKDSKGRPIAVQLMGERLGRIVS